MSGANKPSNIPVDIDTAVETDCNLYWQKPVSAAAANTTTLTLIGQTNDPLTPDQVIVVNVPVAEMKNALIYDSLWEAPQDGATVPGEQPYPHVTFNPKLLADSAVADADSLTAEGRFLTVEAEPSVAAPTFADDRGDDSLWTLQSYFMNSAFSFGSSSVIGQVPAESVKKVEAGKLVVDVLSGDGLPSGDLFEQSDAPILADEYTYTGSGDENFVLELFKQAVAAGKIKAATASSTGGAPTSTAEPADAAGFSKVDFKVNDSITIYVTYNMTKKKKVKLDTADTGADAKFTIMVNGVATELKTDDDETSTVTSVVVAYQFVAV
jgi:hypothetical protein